MDGNEIAIVGYGGKFPGADNCEEFWRLLKNGENHVKDIPNHRWNTDAFFHEDYNEPGKTYVRKAGLIEGHDEWDNQMFQISDVEAARMDPQQRYTLDCVHMALENGGITRNDINGTSTGVFIGVMNDDYKSATNDDLKEMNNYSLTGTAPSIIAARVSYVFNLLGPSMSIDTACSSSLVAIHLAIQAIKNGDCSMAICGGVNGILYPDMFIPLTKARMVSPTGQSQAFSENADGYARGEGCGIVILMKLSEALKEGREIIASIYTGVNQDGRTTTPITAPSGQQQIALLQSVYTSHGIDPSEIDYIEAHGTGTPKGDPIEANALGQFFKKNDKERKVPVKIGSVKTNIGHLESAAGVAGIIKVLLMMKHQTFVPSLHFHVSNQKIDFPKFNFEVANRTEPWETMSCKWACINSFGFGGTNSHAIMKEYIPSDKNIVCKSSTSSRKVPFAITAENRESLQQTIDYVLQHLQSGGWNLHELAFTSTIRRHFFKFRILSFVESIGDLMNDLKNKLISIEKVQPVSLNKPNIVFVFCGVGTTYSGMCSELLRRERVFRDTILKIDKILKYFTSWSIYEHLEYKRDVHEPFIAHLAIFSCQIALSELWKSWGILPNAIVGQSVGEVAAAFAAGAISLDCAVKIIYHRSTILSKKREGTMAVALNINLDEIQKMCDQIGNVSIAVLISKSACTLSGEMTSIKALEIALKEKSRMKAVVTYLNVECAYHSKYVENESLEVEGALQDICGEQPKIKLVSTVSGRTAVDNDFVSAFYWKKNVREPVRFYEGVAECELPNTTNIFVEIGPTTVLNTHFRSIIHSEQCFCLPSMQKNHDMSVIYSTLAEIFCKGIDPKFRQMFENHYRNTLLPVYVPTKTKILFEPESRKQKSRGLILNPSTHLFVKNLEDGLYRVEISPETTPFVYAHVVSGTILVPGAFYVEVALQIGKDTFKTTSNKVSVSSTFVHPVSLSKGKPAVLEATVFKSGKTQLKMELKRGKDLISKSVISLHDTRYDKEFLDIQKLTKVCRKEKSSKEIYSTLKHLGFEYGDDIRILRDAVKNESQCVVRIKLSEKILEGIHQTNIHPAILDGLLQTLGVMQSDDDKRELLPGGIGCILVHRHPEKHMVAVAEIISTDEKEVHYNLTLLNARGAIVAEVQDFWITYIAGQRGKDIRYSISLQRLQSLSENNKVIGPSKKVTILCYTMWGYEKYEEIKKMKNVSIVWMEDLVEYDSLQRKLRSEIHTSDILVFVSNGKLTNASETSNRVFKQSVSNTQALLHVCQTLAGEEKRIPLIVMTYCTQPLGDDCHEHSVNMFGSELWGFTRCIQKENVFLQAPLSVQLIDVHTLFANCETSTSLFLIGQLLSMSGIRDYPELIMCGHSIYSCELSLETIRDGHAHRQNTLDKQGLLEFRATDKDLNNILIFKGNEKSIKRTANAELLEVESFCVHEEAIYSRSPSETVKTNSQSNNSKTLGRKILTFEVVGYKHNSSKPFERNRSPLIGCFPMSVSSIQQIPKSCLCSSNEIQFYSPGLLITAVLLYALLQFVDQNEGVTVITEDENSREFKMLQHILHKRVNVIDPRQAGRIVETKCSKAIILTYLTVTELSNIIQRMKNVTSLISYSFLIDLDLRRFLLEQASFIDLKILEEDVCLSKAHLAKVMPHIFNLLKKEEKHYGKYSRLRSSLFHCKSVSVESLTSPKLHKMQVTMETLFRKDACYVIIGGTTGLGWEVANFLAFSGAGVIVSISRRKPEKSKMEDMQNIEKEYRCQFEAIQADVTKIEELEIAFEKMSKRFMLPIKGIFQGAGILKDSLFQKMSHESLSNVMKPKVLGTWNLHLISLKHDLDYFVMHSSMTSIMGNPGQCNYAAGNSFMDTLAHFRRHIGFCAQSINWGPLTVGMARNSKAEDILRKGGFISLGKDEILSCFADMLLYDHVQMTYGRFDWQIIAKDLSTPSLRNIRSKFKGLLSGGLQNKKPTKDSEFYQANTNFEALFVGKPKTEWKNNIVELVMDITIDVFTLDETQINGNTQFNVLNIDSMLAMTFSNTIEEKTGHKIPIVYLLSDEASINSVSDMILEQVSIHPEHAVEGSGDYVEDKKNDKDRLLVGAMTPFEKKSYDAYLANPNDPSLFIFADLEVSHDLAHPEIWRAILKSLHERYPVLRTVYRSNADNTRYRVKKEILDQTEIIVDFNEVPITSLTHETRLPKDLRPYRFDPERHLPLRTFYACDGSQCILRFVFNHLAIDLTSIWILMKEMKNSKPNENQPIRAVYDVTSLFERKLIKERKELESFWGKEIPVKTSNMSLSSDDVILSPDHFDFTKMQIESRKIWKLRKLLDDQGCTLFHFVVTSFQLLLQNELKCQRSVVTATVDMRIHFRELKDAICRFINPIPLFLEVHDRDTSIKHILRENSSHIIQCIENSLLPFDEIAKYVRNVPLSKIFRHQVIMEDISQSRSLTSSEEYTLRIKRVITGNHNNETVLYVWHDIVKNDVTLELAYSTKAITHDYAHELLRKLAQSIDNILADEQVPVKRMFEITGILQDERQGNKSHRDSISTSIESICDIEGETNEGDNIIAKESMLKQTSRGWDHEVTVQIENHRACWLKWGPMPNKMRRSIPFSDITDVQTRALTNNYALIVETQQRRYIFKSNNKEKVQRLVVMLRENSLGKVRHGRKIVYPVTQDYE
ncbi:hypothetical protein FSP39_024060 [Pinctada imbricata]|uniref:Carrier domain-containing protein n=1 Tax=Pinctada imbricata TaxID=66713 RepID=A0AA88Y9S4_PINIB|nr:hypothetical protein FSP39_024060 [Pinctada imbricata]